MRSAFIVSVAFALVAVPAAAQVSQPPRAAANMSGYATKADVQAAAAAAASAATAASTAQSTANSAVTAAGTAQSKADSASSAAAGAIKSVNGLSPVNGAVTVPIPAAPDLSGYATTSSVTSAISSATAGMSSSSSVTSAINAAIAPLATKSSVTAVQAAIPTPGTGSPSAVVDSNTGVAGADTTKFAPFFHTHPSKARKGRVLVPVAGYVDVVFKDGAGATSPFATGAPLCAVTAETTLGDTNVVNAQMDGQPTMNGMRIRITRTQISVASLLGLSILSVPTQVATYAHYICIEP